MEYSLEKSIRNGEIIIELRNGGFIESEIIISREDIIDILNSVDYVVIQ